MLVNETKDYDIRSPSSSTHGSKDPECACFGELGLNGEAKS
jgi:hypothetical protein